MDARLQILKDAFEKSFAQERFLKFTTEFFGGINMISPDRDNTNIPTEYNYTVESYRHIAYYTSGGDTLDIFAVKLQSGKGRTVERARSMQRSFISKLLSNSNHDAAIAAFYTDDDPRWRLSFVRLDYELAAGRVKLSLTPAKRYSYLVGENEPCHTAMEQLFPIFRNEDYKPTLDCIEEAFSVERVTKDFFEKYKDKYFVLKEYLDGSDVFNDEATRCGFTSEQFAKKLMGQLAFLYFLQKKGWLGISVLPHVITKKQFDNAYWNKQYKGARLIIPQIYESIVATDEYKLKVNNLRSLSDSDADIAASCFKSDEWGTGEKRFIRRLFSACKQKNFFDEFLTPLFYEALNQKRGNKSFYKRFNCKIPFLNGGLFEPLEGYDWEFAKFAIPNDIFSNIEEKGEREADGILDIFDRYNFTMNEDEPLEREVAVDPEMLGKIFENLLDSKDRKSKGAFYTPREIVHYMCAESLIHYLVGKTGVSYGDIKIFIVDGELLKDEDYNTRGERKLPQSVYEKLYEIDEALKNIKVADPAVGSGAFPLGMLSEIVKARNNITYYYAAMHTTSAERARIFEQRDPYTLKWQTIQNSIFAVDIEASAVDIAKLRLWLSLVVDEDLSPSYEEIRWGVDAEQKDPRPLPNLDYNIMCGNSLIDEFEGIQLFDDTILGKDKFSTAGVQANLQLSLFQDSIAIYLDDLRKEQERFFGEQNQDAKQEIKARIDKIIDDIIRAKLQRDNNAEGLRKYEESLKQKTKPYFLWKLEFARIFRESGGFDIVIGNPPYVDSEEMVRSMPETRAYYANKYRVAKGNWDLFVLFIELGQILSASSGSVSYIVPNKLVAADYAKETRKLMSTMSVREIRDYSDVRVFLEAAVYPVTFITSMSKGATDVKMIKMKNLNNIYWENTVSHDNFLIAPNWDSFFSKDVGAIAIIEKMKQYKPLETYAIVKGAATVSEAYELKKILTDTTEHTPDYLKFINTGTIDRYVSYWHSSKTQYIKQGYYKPILLRSDLSKMYPRRFADAVATKIIIGGMTKILECYYDNGEYLAGKSTTVVLNSTVSLKGITGILNSKLMTFFYQVYFNSLSLAGGYLRIGAPQVKQLPIATDNSLLGKIENVVDMINEVKQSDPTADTSTLEAEIDRMVYELYGLTDEEIKIVEGAV